MAEIRTAIILDQHLASTTPEARTRRPTLAHKWSLHPLSLDTHIMLGTQVKNNTTTYKAIVIASPDSRSHINLEWVRPLNEPRHKGQSLWISSAMLCTKMPPLNPPPLNNSPLHDLEIIVPQKDARHVRIFIQPYPTLHEILRKFLGHLHCPTSLATDDHTSPQARSIVQNLITFCANAFDPKNGTQTYASLTTPTTTRTEHPNLDDIDRKYTELTTLRTSPPARQQPGTPTNNNTRTAK
jgi:hypothetical protein